LYQQQFNVEQASFAMASVQDTKVQVRSSRSVPLFPFRRRI